MKGVLVMKDKKIKYTKEVMDSKWEVMDLLVEHYEDEGFQVYNGYYEKYNECCPMCRKKIPTKGEYLNSGLVNPCPIVSKGRVWVIFYVLCLGCEKETREMSFNNVWMKKTNMELAMYFYNFIEKDMGKDHEMGDKYEEGED